MRSRHILFAFIDHNYLYVPRPLTSNVSLILEQHFNRRKFVTGARISVKIYKNPLHLFNTPLKCDIWLRCILTLIRYTIDMRISYVCDIDTPYSAWWIYFAIVHRMRLGISVPRRATNQIVFEWKIRDNNILWIKTNTNNFQSTLDLF